MTSQPIFLFFFFFWAGLHDPIACSLLGGVITPHNIGYTITRLCPYLYYFATSFPPSSILACCYSKGVHFYTPLHSAPLEPLAPLDSSLPKSESESDSVSNYVSLSDPLSFTPSKSMPACSHHRQDTLAPGRRVDRSQRPKIGCATIYCATMLCLLVTYFMIPSKPAYPIASSNDGYAQLPPPCLLGCLTVSCRMILFWKLSMARSIRGVSTHVSAPNSNTAYDTA